jgi:SAM-dependent methyltransferase
MQSVGATLPREKFLTVQTGALPVQHGVHYIKLICPSCRRNLTAISYHALGIRHEVIQCRVCRKLLAQQSEIWIALPEDRRYYFEEFLRDYETVRRAEGRGSDAPDFYLELPYVDRTGNHSWEWEIRARTYSYIEKKILPEVRGLLPRAITVLDLGAGNGWLSHRLSALGHRSIAIDLQTNSFDGLGAAVHYKHSLPMLFPRFQAELDRLPFAEGQFDCAIFNASFHYSENYDRTLAEAIRCLRPGGTIVIADSPSYSRDESGQKMLQERRESFQKRFGFASDRLSSCEYLTKERLLALEAKHDVRWTAHEAWYGLRWACRPLVAKLKGRREPSRFRIYTAQVKAR